MDKPEYISVSLLNQYLERKFRRDPYLETVYLVGEISNFRERKNSHQYFSIKDDKSKISAVMFKSAFQKIKFQPEEGMKVLVIGTVTLYQPSGSYQINIRQMEPDGVGALYQAFEQLKKKLAAEGLFDQPKKTIPRFPKRIAVVTSPSGAVIRDIITTVKRRFQSSEIVLFPAVVQGNQAKYSIVEALQQIEEQADKFDVVIIGRGGGSIEDLWPFNEEIVVRELAKMPLPVISSVGHETDVTLSDFVADVRAATPTAAAELATPDLKQELAHLKQIEGYLLSRMNTILNLKQQQVKRLKNSYIFKNPMSIYEPKVQQLDLLYNRLYHTTSSQIKQKQHLLALTKQRFQPRLILEMTTQKQQNIQKITRELEQKMTDLLKAKIQQQIILNNRLSDLNPTKIISRGYSILTDGAGEVVSSVQQVEPKQELAVKLSDGTLTVQTVAVREDEK